MDVSDFSYSVFSPVLKVYTYNSADQIFFSEENDDIGFWDILQMATSIFCACGPMYKSMLPSQPLWARSKIPSITSGASRKSHYMSAASDKTESAESSKRQGSDGSNISGTTGMTRNWPESVD
jgi:hypothetical protein